MLHGESTNGRCSMEQAKGMRALSEGCAAFLGMVPRGRLCKMWHVNKDLKEVRRLPMWRYRTEVSCCEDIQNQDSKAAICLIYVRHSKEAGIWGRTLTGGSRISDWRVKQAMLAHRQLFWVRWKSCPTLCDPANCSITGFSVHHYLLEFPQTHVHWVTDAIQPPDPLSPPSPLALNLSQQVGTVSFPISQLFTSGGQSIGALASVSIIF